MAKAIAQYVVDTTVLSQGKRSSAPSAAAAPLVWVESRFLYQLLILNVVLQCFDGVATFAGMQIGFHEGNPLLRDAFEIWGVGPALLLFKAQACGFLVLVYRIADASLALFALGLLATVYCTFSLIPWLSMLTTVFLRSL